MTGQNYKYIKRGRQKNYSRPKKKQTARTEEVGNGGRSNIHARESPNGRNTKHKPRTSRYGSDILRNPSARTDQERSMKK